jgi:predicted HicB family RNase H-like nuclease
MGRPKKPPKQRSSRLIALRLTPAEHKALEQAAEKAKVSLSDYVRSKLDLRGVK